MNAFDAPIIPFPITLQTGARDVPLELFVSKVTTEAFHVENVVPVRKPKTVRVSLVQTLQSSSIKSVLNVMVILSHQKIKQNVSNVPQRKLHMMANVLLVDPI